MQILILPLTIRYQFEYNDNDGVIFALNYRRFAGAIVLIVGGSLMLVFGFLGCYGAINENPTMLLAVRTIEW